MTLMTIRRSPARNALIVADEVYDLSRYFTIARDAQGVRADRAGEGAVF